MTVKKKEIVEFGSTKCICPKCGHEILHRNRGIPCNKIECPICGTKMQGTQCMED